MIRHLLNRTLQVWRPSTVTDAIGGQTVSFDLVGTVRCSVAQPTVEERRLAAQNGAELTHHVHMAAGADVRRGDELAGDLPAPARDGDRLRVIAVVADSRSTYRRAGCEITQSEGS